MKKRLLSRSAALLLILLAQPAIAATIWVNDVKIETISGAAVGYVYWQLKLEGHYASSCTVRAIQLNVSTDTGKAQYSMLLAAYLADKTVSVEYEVGSYCNIRTVKLGS